MISEEKCAKDIVELFAEKCKISLPKYETLNNGGENFLAIYTGNRNEFFLNVLSDIGSEMSEDNPFKNSVFLSDHKIENWLLSSEVEYLQTLLSESLTIGRDSLKSNFHKKFIPFVGGEEKRIDSKTNNIIYGRRGSGKSSLILYGCNKIIEHELPFVWIAMQQYQGRKDIQVIPQFLYEMVAECEGYLTNGTSLKLKEIIFEMEKQGLKLTFDEVKVNLPLFSRYFLPFVKSKGAFYLFIDDLHLLGNEIQPLLLSAIYSIARGNNVYLKISAIENLTSLYNYELSEGMQSPGDIQIIRLDYNLLNPERAHKHISEILKSYAQYAGIPSLNKIFDLRTRHRLTWVCAGVPRDALYIFDNSISKAMNENRKKVAITDINMAAADSMTEKEKFLSDDVSDDQQSLRELIEEIKSFCVDVPPTHLEFPYVPIGTFAQADIPTDNPSG